MIWRKPLRWEWTYDEEPGIGGTEYSVEIVSDKIAWRYSEDRWGRSGEQSHADFAAFGPLRSAPDEIVAEMAAHFELREKPWQAPGYVDYSKVWWAVDGFKEADALRLLSADEARRRYHGQRTLLMLAALNSQAEVVRELLSLGADVNASDENGVTALMDACRQLPTPTGIIRLLLDHGADVNARDRHGRTPLILFCITLNPTMEPLRLLLERGADPKVRDDDGVSPRDSLQRKYLPAELLHALGSSGGEAALSHR